MLRFGADFILKKIVWIKEVVERNEIKLRDFRADFIIMYKLGCFNDRGLWGVDGADFILKIQQHTQRIKKLNC